MTEPLLFRSPRRTEASGIRTRYSDKRERFARMPERALFLPDGWGPYEHGESHPTGGKYDKELPATVPIPMFLRSSGLSSCPTTDGTECTAPPRAGTTRTRNPCSETIACRNDGRPSQTPDSRCPSVPPFSAFGSSRTPGFPSPTSAGQPPVAANRAAFHTETRTLAVFPLFSSGKTGDGLPRSIPSNCPARHGNRHIARKPECRTNGTRSAYRSKRFSFAIGRDDETIACGNRAKGSRNFYG